MSGFRKKTNTKAALKIGIYGPPGSGKTFTSLLCMEGIAKGTGKRFAYVDTEQGTDFYASHVPARSVHPEAFDFDALETRSITEVLAEVRKLDPEIHCGVVFDSITHLWEATQAAYTGKRTSTGGIPIEAWSRVKKPYKDLIAWILSTPLHVIICGRQGNDFDTGEDGKMTKVGVKMKAEGETAYEPDILIRMEPEKVGGVSKLWALGEKDRTGVISGKWIELPADQSPGYTFRAIVQPLMGLVSGTTHGSIDSDADTIRDQEVLDREDADRTAFSTQKTDEIKARFTLAKTLDELDAVGAELTPEIKKRMLTAHIAELREMYQDRDMVLTRNGSTRAEKKSKKAAKESEKDTAALDALARWRAELDTASDQPGIDEVKDQALKALPSSVHQDFMTSHTAASARVRKAA